MSVKMKQRIQLRTLSDLCGAYLLKTLKYDFDVIQSLLPELVFTRIDQVLPMLELEDNQQDQQDSTQSEEDAGEESDE